MSNPETTKQWTIETKGGLDSLILHDSIPIPPLGDHEVLVNFKAASLNYRDLSIPLGTYPFPTKTPCIPCSDGAGTVLSVGPRVTRFRPGDQVLTLFNQAHIAGATTPAILGTGVGGVLDGVLRQYGTFGEEGLVAMPRSLSFAEASTLPCAALTAWNALFGLVGRGVRPGETVLTQGTGGVSLFAVQFAKAAGARVIATTSSDDKAALLKKLGADHIINYKSDPEWGASAKKLTANEAGVDHIIEVGGPRSMAQSLAAVKIEGVINIIGFLGGVKGMEQPSFLECLFHICVVRGILVGSRELFEEMNRAIDVNGIKPVVDEKVFGLAEAKDAFQYLLDQKHVGKVVINID